MSQSCFSRIASAVGAVVLLFGGPVASAGAHEPTSAATSLHAGFKMAPKLAWTRQNLSLSEGRWHLNAPDGPIATAAQIRQVLRGPFTMEIGGRCQGWAERDTHYPCGFEVAELVVGGNVANQSMRLHAVQMIEKSQETSGPARRQLPDLSAHGLISPLPLEEAFVAVRLAGHRLVRPADVAESSLAGVVLSSATAGSETLAERTAGAAEAYGAALSFRLRPVTNPIVPSIFNRDSGAVILRVGAPGPMPAGQLARF